MKIMITGGNGMVGRNLLDHPLASKFSILSPSRGEVDLFSKVAIGTFLEANRPDLIVHSAGKVGGIKANIADPAGFFRQNLVMGMNLLEAARDAGVNRIINLGSTCMYPREAKNPLVEESILTGGLEPTNEGYALAKISVQRLGAYMSAGSHEFQVKTIIPCNLYGPYDKFDEVNAHLIPAIIANSTQQLQMVTSMSQFGVMAPRAGSSCMHRILLRWSGWLVKDSMNCLI